MYNLRRIYWIGRQNPPISTAIGGVLLAWKTWDDEVKQILISVEGNQYWWVINITEKYSRRSAGYNCLELSQKAKEQGIKVKMNMSRAVGRDVTGSVGIWSLGSGFLPLNLVTSSFRCWCFVREDAGGEDVNVAEAPAACAYRSKWLFVDHLFDERVRTPSEQHRQVLYFMAEKESCRLVAKRINARW